jgi:hypothetical protein
MMGPPGERGGVMARGDRRKCLCCRKLFRPDPRNRRHQRYCSKPCCRAASKAASQARWLAAPDNQNYFKGAAHVARVREWRSRHPRYWSRAGPLQDHSLAQPVDFSSEVDGLARPALQDFLTAQPAVLIGLIAHLVGTRLQDSIERTTDRLLRLGQDILATAATEAGRQQPEPRTRSPPEP